MGASRTLVYQIGRFYKLNGIQYRAISEKNRIVTFESFDLWNPKAVTIRKKQQYRIDKKDRLLYGL